MRSRRHGRKAYFCPRRTEEMRELLTAKANIDRILGKEDRERHAQRTDKRSSVELPVSAISEKSRSHANGVFRGFGIHPNKRANRPLPRKRRSGGLKPVSAHRHCLRVFPKALWKSIFFQLFLLFQTKACVVRPWLRRMLE